MLSKEPIIKWTGSKRKQAPSIVSYFPRKIKTYYEPFVGGGSVLHELLNRIATHDIECERIVCVDINKDLIDFYNAFRNNRQELYDYYCKLHNELKARAHYIEGTPVTTKHVEMCKGLYYEMREKYNKMDKNDPERPYIFYWITRTSFNGLIRYNSKGEFNSPFHVAGRFGITPEKLEHVFEAWGEVIDMMGDRIEFVCDDYFNVIKDAGEGDVVYMDPPYIISGGMYFTDEFDHNLLYQLMAEMTTNGVKWLLSYDGFSGATNNTAELPDIYTSHVYVNSGHSSFKKLKSKSVGTNAKDVVYDSLYTNFEIEDK